MPNKEFATKRINDQLEGAIYTGEGGAGLTPILDPRYYVHEELFGLFGSSWYYWRVQQQNTTQVEPPQDVKDARAEYEAVLTKTTTEDQIAQMKKVLQTAADKFWCIGIARPGTAYQPQAKNLMNQPQEWIGGFTTGVEKLTRPEQWYLKQ
jgi:hypothetical protein